MSYPHGAGVMFDSPSVASRRGALLPVIALLLSGADGDGEWADRAWSAMQTWEVAETPSQLQEQIERALATTDEDNGG